MHIKLHNEERGCKLKFKFYPGRKGYKGRKSLCRGYYCETHKKNCSLTGWEWRWFGGTFNK